MLVQSFSSSQNPVPGLKSVSKRKEFQHLHFFLEDTFDHVSVEPQVEGRAQLLVIPHDLAVPGIDAPDPDKGRRGSYPGDRCHARILVGIIDVVGVDEFPRQIGHEVARLRLP